MRRNSEPQKEIFGTTHPHGASQAPLPFPQPFPYNTPVNERRRIDLLLVEKGLAVSRTQARAMVEAGQVTVAGEVVTKPGREFPPETPIATAEPLRFVSRGGEKLAAYLQAFPVPVQDAYVLDIGASTGGFTDCVLQNGAVHVTCLDVGQGQLHPKLLADPRVTNIEKVNIRHVRPEDLPYPTYNIVVMDVSFISLRLTLPPAWQFVKPEGGHLIALIKPQFEVGKAIVDRGKGIVRDPQDRENARNSILTFAEDTLPHATLLGTIPSPLIGTDGNHEYLSGWKHTSTETL
jgi:23S rRNA (cytidine1920-2'-O)/16S rRNA (cytidine1409-2'-O)-methyltransferase